MALGHRKLVPDGFEVPDRIETDRFVVVPLTRRLLALDFEAYMSSVEHLKATYNVDEPFMVHGAKWPERATPDDGFLDVAWCEFERLNRTSFAYAVLDPAEERELGCVYVFPCKKAGFAAECRMWVRQSELARGLDEALETWFRDWIDQVWPFAPGTAAWPGRRIAWDEWTELPDKEPWA